MSTFKPRPTPLDTNSYPDDFSPCHRRVLSARAVAPAQLNKSLAALIPVAELNNADRAAERIYQALQTGEKIVIVGDYDADGATAAAVLSTVLSHLQANCDSVIPNRVKMGYGLSDKAVAAAIDKAAQLVITVDNGITACDSVERLKTQGIDVIITDHHLPPDTLPQAKVIVNPNQKGCHFPSKALAGVGVIFYVVLALRQLFRERNDPRLDAFSVTDLLPYVAIGTVADVVPLDFNNRILVEQGLKRIRAGHCPPGVAALIDIAGLNREKLSAPEIAFQIAPRLNAAGRIADMQLGLDCLLAKNERLATDYAIELDRLNRERRTLENEMRAQADQLIIGQQSGQHAHSLCVFDSAWSEGLIGILAARLKDTHGKTTFVFTRAEDGLLKASARAATAVNLIEALNALNGQHPDLLSNFGGHAKAAGLSLSPEHLALFETTIEDVLSEQLRHKSVDETIYTDGELLPYEMNVANAEFLRNLEPWGAELPEPLFENTAIRAIFQGHCL